MPFSNTPNASLYLLGDATQIEFRKYRDQARLLGSLVTRMARVNRAAVTRGTASVI